MKVDADAPYALADPDEIARRREMLVMSHIAPLIMYAAAIKAQRGDKCEMPLFDPCDGGVNSRLLFLLEAPGPKAVGSSFISRNNPDQTAKNMNLLLREAGLPREQCLLWNIVPWYVGDGRRIRAVRRTDLSASTPYLRQLIDLLPELQAIILVGKHAASAKAQIQALTNVPIYTAPHPSPKVFNVYPAKRSEALKVFDDLRQYIVSRPNTSLECGRER